MVGINTRFARKHEQWSRPMPKAHKILDPVQSIHRAKKTCALAVMTKAPRAGHVKTRLQPPLTAEEAAQLVAEPELTTILLSARDIVARAGP